MKRKVVALAVALSLLANLFAFSTSFASAIPHAPNLGVCQMATLVGTVQFKAYNGLYVTADVNNGGALTANRSVAKTWETFDVCLNSDGTASFRAHANNLFVSARFNLTNTPLIANAPTINAWEKFVLIYDPSDPSPTYTCAIQTASAPHNFASADPNHSSQLLADRADAKLWEHYALYSNGSSTPDAGC